MTFIDDPRDERYHDEADARRELSRVAETCFGCRRCVDRCGVFPTLIDLLERIDDHDAGRLTPEEQDGLVDACFHCGECALGCPYSPGVHEADIDMPRAMLRAEAVRHESGRRPLRDRLATAVLARPTSARLLVGTSSPGTLRRRLVAAVTGLSASAPALSGRDRRRIETTGSVSRAAGPVARAVLVTGCTHDAFDERAVPDALALAAHLGIACDLVEIDSCGAASLQAGELVRFERIARRNLQRLARQGGDDVGGDDVGGDGPAVIVLDPTCRSTIAVEYTRHVPVAERSRADSVADRIVDIASWLAPTITGDRAEVGHVVVHAACRTGGEAGDDGATQAIVDLVAQSGSTVTVVEGCSGIGSVCGQRSVKDLAVRDFGERFIQRIDEAMTGDGVVVTPCGASGAAIAASTGLTVLHPVSLLARAVETSAG